LSDGVHVGQGQQVATGDVGANVPWGYGLDLYICREYLLDASSTFSRMAQNGLFQAMARY
jgi:hypothetical protein